MPTDTHFDERAQTWDSDPVKVARALAVAEGIRNHVPVSPQTQSLEYGCGTGLLSFALHDHLGRVTLADSSEGMLSVLRDKIATAGATNMHPMKLDLSTDPIPPDRYDLIYSLMTLHHIMDTEQLLRDLHTLLRSSGFLCVADLDAEDGSFHGPEFTGHKGFDREDLRCMAGRAGFGDITFTTVFRMLKGNGPEQKDYPLFLMVARK